MSSAPHVKCSACQVLRMSSASHYKKLISSAKIGMYVATTDTTMPRKSADAARCIAIIPAHRHIDTDHHCSCAVSPCTSPKISNPPRRYRCYPARKCSSKQVVGCYCKTHHNQRLSRFRPFLRVMKANHVPRDVYKYIWQSIAADIMLK